MGDARSEPRPRGVRGDLGAVAAGAVAAAVVRQGAFDPLDAVLFPGILLGLVLLTRARVERRWRVPLLLLAALAVWWLVAAIGWGKPVEALPLFGSFVGFGAGALLAANAPPSQAALVRRLVVLGATAFAAVGLIGVAFRWYPIVMEAQGLWRLSGTLTYANAAGLLLAMALPLALAERFGTTRWSGVAVTLVFGSLVATMSRGAAVALLLAVPLLRRHLRDSSWPLLLGAGIGAAAVVTASSSSAQPAVLVVAAAAAGLAVVRPPAPVAVAVLALVAAAVIAVPAWRDGLATVADRRLSPAELDDRTPEWRGAVREFARSPVVGTGPERPFLSRHAGKTELARYAHSEPLQVAMSAGFVGFALLVTAGGSLYRVISTGSGRVDAARAGLVVFVVGGVADFSWHLPAIGIIGGVLAALAAREEEPDEVPADRYRSRDPARPGPWASGRG